VSSKTQETSAVCHAFLSDTRFWAFLLRVDEDLAAQVRAAGCRCGGVLHSARYPRKPRGIARSVLGEGQDLRLSFCCAREGCRRRTTPPSVRFLGRRVFLGAVLVLILALAHGLPGRVLDRLGERFGASARTLRRWRHWWQEEFVATPWWRTVRGGFIPPPPPRALPGALLERFTGADLASRLLQMLVFLLPLSTHGSDSARVVPDPQKMRLLPVFEAS
jgi:hypothetical protein